MRQRILFFWMLGMFSSAFGQNRGVDGQVTAKEDGQPIPGVNVVVKGTTKGVATDLDGRYHLELAAGEEVLVFSFIGYKSVEETVGTRTQINVALESEQQQLEEVVVVAYGTQKKSDLTGAVGTLKGADITKIPALDPTMALQGKVAGVQVVSSSGAPGSQPIVRIRGVGTFNDASPIYVVDGVILQDISFLNASDIQSMEVLKDASATALYGSRGANGVILITTKMGKRGGSAPVITVSGDYSIQDQYKRIDLLNGKQFATVVNEFAPGSFNNTDAVANTDWQSQIFKKPLQAPIQNYQMSVTGSSEKIQYYLGVGYFKQNGVIPYSSYERLSVRFNNVYNLSKQVRIGSNLSLAPFWQQNGNGGVVYTAYRAQPTIAPYTASGNYSVVPGVGNPIADMQYHQDNHARGLRTVGNFYAEADFLKAFSFKSSIGVDLAHQQSYAYTPVYFVDAAQQLNPDELDKEWNDRLSWLWENTLTFNKEIGVHRINALAGFTMQESTSDILNTTNRGLLRPAKDFWYYNQRTTSYYAEETVDPNQYYSMISFLGRVNYTFNNKYLFTATFRRDGSSKFNKSNRYGNFPSVAAGWNVINEDFMKNTTLFSNLKLRASWGIIGNEKITYTDRFSPTDKGNVVLGTKLVNGLTYGVSGNDDLKWESTYQTDVGLEMGFLDGKLTAEADFYNRDTRDILVYLPVPSFLGNGPGAKIRYNAAEVLNRGFELTLGWKDQVNDQWSYQINGNVTTIHNEVLKVSGVGGNNDYLDNSDGGNTLTRTVVGKPIGTFFMYQTAGVFQNAGQVSATPHLAGAGPGDLIFADANKDGVLNADDRIFAGSAIPTFMYGLNLGTSWKAFELSIDINGLSGNKILNYKEIGRPNLYNFEQHVWGRWTGEGTSNSEPRATAGGYNWQPSTRFIQSGAYVRLRSVTVSYTIPKSLTTAFQSARVFVRGTNLFTLTKYTGYTPEVGATDPTLNGLDRGTYPLPAVYTVGANITF